MDPRQAVGARTRLQMGGFGKISFAALPAAPAAPKRSRLGAQRTVRRGGLAMLTFGGWTARALEYRRESGGE
eukprot:14392352-Alexandrium_andersonii.AAC.1